MLSFPLSAYISPAPSLFDCQQSVMRSFVSSSFLLSTIMHIVLPP